MAPLSIEIYNQGVDLWIKAGELKPGDQPGSLSDNKPDGSRDIYLFECAPDDLSSTVYRSEVGADIEVGQLRVVDPVGNLEVIKRLKQGESFEMEIKTDKSPEPHRIRFTHR